jgi:hypothetical protein
MNEVNFENITFSTPLCQLRRVKKQNEQFSLNVYTFVDNKDIVPVYISKHTQRDRHIDLLLITNESSKSHYIWITSMSRLVAGRTRHAGKTFVCPHCCWPYTNYHTFDNPFMNCQLNRPKRIQFPDVDRQTVKFRSHNKIPRFDVAIYCDFESYLARGDKDDVMNIHEPSGFCIYVVSLLNELVMDPIMYSGPDAMN